jgi:hypothetical protein
MRAYSGRGPKNRPKSAHFVRKSGDLFYCDRSTALTDLRRQMRAGATAAPPTASDALGSPEKNEGIQTLRSSPAQILSENQNMRYAPR